MNFVFVLLASWPTGDLEPVVMVFKHREACVKQIEEFKKGSHPNWKYVCTKTQVLKR